MIKYKTTDKEQREGNGIVLGFSYCSIQNIERYLQPNAYTCGVYGWRADFYEFDGFTISTGYSPLNFINKTGYRDIDAFRFKKAAVLREEILKLEKKLDKNRYKWQCGGDWHKARENVRKIINKIIYKANKAGEAAAAPYRA